MKKHSKKNKKIDTENIELNLKNVTSSLCENKILTRYDFETEFSDQQMSNIVKNYLKNTFNIDDNCEVKVEQNCDREGILEGFVVTVRICKETETFSGRTLSLSKK